MKFLRNIWIPLTLLSILLLPGCASKDAASTSVINPVEVVDGKQIITVTAKGGYKPRKVAAKADMPTLLRMKTQSTFDCSASFIIPDLGIEKMLPATGTTEFDLGTQVGGTEIVGLCSMGMYSFTITFT